MDHPLAGRMSLEYHSFYVNGAPTQRVVVYTPLPQDNTLQKLTQLLAQQRHSQHDEEASPVQGVSR
jgi:hypothetical protein